MIDSPMVKYLTANIGLVAAAFVLSPQVAFAQEYRGGVYDGNLLSQRLEAELDGSGKRERELREFYAARQFRPLWIEDGVPNAAADTFLRLADTARYDGLSRKALRVDDLLSALRRSDSGTPKDLVRAELALSRTLAAYVQGTRIARDSGMNYQNSLLAPVVPSIGSALAEAAKADSLDDYLGEMRWMHPLYGQLRAALTARQLDAEATQRVQLNLERARALPANPAPRYVLIDAAGATLSMYENGKVVDTMRVVVGKPGQATPMIAGELSSAILNPYWNVPPDLVRDRIATNVNAKGLGYLKTGGYQVLSDWSDDAKVVSPARVDWRAVEAGAKEQRVRQLPGRSNFMGKVKFTFPNNLGIYLHDTPDKALLKEDTRQASSGCVRLQDATRFGRWLFGKTLVPKKGAVEQSVSLDQPVPVYITYLTAAPENGRIVFRDDTYDRDQTQLAVLRRAGRNSR